MATNTERDYRPFIPECTKRGIGKTRAYELADAGLLETFCIGRKRFIYLDSLLTLPHRLMLAEMAARGIPVTETDAANDGEARP